MPLFGHGVFYPRRSLRIDLAGNEGILFHFSEPDRKRFWIDSLNRVQELVESALLEHQHIAYDVHCEFFSHQL